MIVLSKEQIAMLHEQLIDETGGIHGIRDKGLLESSVMSPFQSFDGKDMFYLPPSVVFW